MGRPRDQFAWAQVEKLENGTWKCIHCKKVHSGAASRIRNHLSGQGNGIAPCEEASEAIKKEALKRVIQKKRVRGNSLAVSTSRATEEITVIDAFVKFLMCNHNVPSIDSYYVVKDPSLRQFLESLCQCGVELSLLRGNSLALQDSVLRIKHEVDRNMLMQLRIECCGLQLEEDALQFWEELKSKIEVIANTKIFEEGSCSRLGCSYLNPVYFLQQLEKDPLLPAYKLKEALGDLAEIRKEDQDKIDEEVELYGQVFSKLSSVELKGRHPVKLWEEHGSDLPVLQRCALKLLNRPLSCPCKQVKEHLYELQDADDYILRLNFRMMRHFQHLGDDIYKPLNLTLISLGLLERYYLTDIIF